MSASVLTPVEEQIAFHQAIGMAIAQWAHVENALYNINVDAFAGAHWKTVGASFYAIENFRTKLAFTDKAVKQSGVFDARISEWIEARDHIASLSKARNKIAHCRTITYPDAKPGRRYAIVPISYDERRIKSRKGPPPGSLCVRDVDLASRQFSRAANWLFAIRDPRAIPVPPEPRPRTLVELRHQIELIHAQRAPKLPR